MTESAQSSTGTPGSPSPNFFKRHDKVLTVIGAIIVFLGYVAKEVIKDDLKDFGDELARARSDFAQFEVEEQIFTEIRTVRIENGKHFQAMARTLPGKFEGINQNTDYDFLYEVWSEAGFADLCATRLKSLNEKLPSHEESGKELDELTHDFSKMREAKPLLKRVSELHSGPKKLSDTEFNEIEANVTQVNQWDTELVEDSKKLDKIYHSVLDKATREHEINERSYGVCKIVSYILYTIGWGLALVGKMSGVEVSAGE